MSNLKHAIEMMKLHMAGAHPHLQDMLAAANKEAHSETDSSSNKKQQDDPTMLAALSKTKEKGASRGNRKSALQLAGERIAADPNHPMQKEVKKFLRNVKNEHNIEFDLDSTDQNGKTPIQMSPISS